MNRTLPVVALALLSVVLPRTWPLSERPRDGAEVAFAPLAPDRPLASLVPPRCSVYIESPDLAGLLAGTSGGESLGRLLSGPLALLLEKGTGESPEALLRRGDEWLGTALLPVAASLSRKGAALAVDVGREQLVLITRGSDSTSVQRGLETLLDAIERAVGIPGALDRASDHWGDAEAWRLGDGWLAHRETLLVAGRGEELLREVLALAADPAARGWLDSPGFRSALESRPKEIALWSWLDLAALEPTGDPGFRELRRAGSSPPFQALLGPSLAALVSADSLCSELTLEDRRLCLHLRGLGAPAPGPLSPGARPGSAPARPHDGGGPELLEALVHRDYGGLITHRLELFGADSLPGFAELVTTGALFFGGRDLGEEVLDHVSPWIRLIAEPATFEDPRRPDIELPAVALIALLDDPAEGETWITALQSLLAVIGVDRAQKGQVGMRLRLGQEGAVEITSASFPSPRTGEGVDLRYNLEPALAVVGRHLVLGTHVSLVRDLVRRLDGLEPEDAPVAERVVLNLVELGHGLERESEALVARKRVLEGLSAEAARLWLEQLLGVLATFERAEISATSADPKSPEVSLILELSPGDGR